VNPCLKKTEKGKKSRDWDSKLTDLHFQVPGDMRASVTAAVEPGPLCAPKTGQLIDGEAPGLCEHVAGSTKAPLPAQLQGQPWAPAIAQESCDTLDISPPCESEQK
jgi:hypothetical protein